MTGPVNGVLVDNGDGTFDYTPDPDFFGTDTFTYTISDPEPLTSNIATVTITVSSVNDAPVAADDTGVGYTTTEDVPFTTGDVTANDSDVDDPVDPASLLVASGVSNGVLVNNGDGTFDYTPDPDWFGTESFTYTVFDSGLLLSNVATVTIAVTADNDAPVGADDSGVGYTTPEDVPLTTGDVTANDSDVVDPVDPTSVSVASGVLRPKN